MAIKTFTTGEVLTASDTNTYLNNGGLVYITSQTVGSGVTSVTVSNVFSSTYDNYRLTMNNVQGSAVAANLLLTFDTTTSGYYYGGHDITYNGTVAVISGSNAASINVGSTAGSAFGGEQGMSIDIFSPYLAVRSCVYSTGFGSGSGRWVGGELATASSNASVKISISTGTMTGGTITVYGYRKA